MPSTRWFLGHLDTFLTPWHSRPISLAYDVFCMCANCGCLRSWRYCNDCPEVLSRKGIVKLWANWAGYCRLAAWARVITLAVAVGCARVRREIGLRSVALDTLGGGGSTLCGNLDLLHRATGS